MAELEKINNESLNSILTSIKKLLGIEEDYEHFDVDIILHINTAFTKLNQLGVGPKEGFSIRDKTSQWDDYIQGEQNIESVKSYVFIDVKLIFDPPQPNYVVEVYKDQRDEIGWRLNIQVEGEENND